MSACLFGFPILSDGSSTVSATLSGGSWLAGLPLTNLQDARLARVARSSNATTLATQFDVDLGAARDIRVFAIPKHTLSRTARFRLRASDVAGVFTAPLYDSGWLDVLPVVYPTGSLPWGRPGAWDGKPSIEEAAYWSIGLYHVTPSPVLARYWRVELDDTTNTAGYVDLARLVLSPGYVPTINMSYGARIGYSSASVRAETDGGAYIVSDKPRRREQAFTIEHLPENEALVHLFDMQRRAGISAQLVFFWDEADDAHRARRAMLCQFKELSPIECALAASGTIPFSLIEVL